MLWVFSIDVCQSLHILQSIFFLFRNKFPDAKREINENKKMKSINISIEYKIILHFTFPYENDARHFYSYRIVQCLFLLLLVPTFFLLIISTFFKLFSFSNRISLLSVKTWAIRNVPMWIHTFTAQEIYAHKHTHTRILLHSKFTCQIRNKWIEME